MLGFLYQLAWDRKHYNQSWRRKDGTRVRIQLPPQRELAGSSRQRSLTFEGLANATMHL